MKKLITFFLTLFVASSVWAQVSPNHKYELGDTIWFMDDNRPIFGVICAINTCTYVDDESATKKEGIDYVFKIIYDYDTDYYIIGEDFWKNERYFCRICSVGGVKDYSKIFLSKKELIESLYKKD